MARTISMLSLVLFALPVFSQTATAPTFDVAAIRPSSMTYGSYIRYLPGGRLSAMSWIKQLIEVAYDVKDYQVTGGPGWLTSDRYVIEAKAENPDVTKGDTNLMLQALLADRFKLRFHKESKDFKSFDLVVDKNGPKLTPLKEGEASRCRRDNSLICGMTSPEHLAGWLGHVVGQPVFDKTGISGKFDVLLDFDIYSAQGKTPPDGFDKPSLTDALHDQLGLRLQPHKEALPVLVVDSIQRPTEN